MTLDVTHHTTDGQPAPPIPLNLRLRNYYRYIRDRPVSFTQYDREALTILADRAAESLSPEQFNACMNLAGPQASQGWAGVRPGDFDFPRDHGPHYDIRDEWYYLAGNFVDRAGEAPISIVFSSRRRGIVPPFMQPPCEPGDFDLWLQQIAVTIPADGAHTNSLTYFLGANTPTEMSSEPFRWTVGGQGLRSVGSDMFPMRFCFGDGEVTIRLVLTIEADGAGIFPQGKEGCAPCISGLGYRYYTWPIVHATGTLEDRSTGLVRRLRGTMWMDHQWGARLAPFGYLDSVFLRAWMAARNQVEPHFTRWNWLYFHLLDGRHVTDAVTTVKIPADDVQSGTGPFPLTHTTYVDGELNYRSQMGGGTVEAAGFLKNPISETVYPHGWKLELEDMEVELKPSIADQFIGTEHDIGVWEGGVTVEGTRGGEPVRGYGFVEIMGYEDPDQLIDRSLELLGLDPSNREPFRPSPFGLRVRVHAMLVLALPLCAAVGAVAMLVYFAMGLRPGL